MQRYTLFIVVAKQVGVFFAKQDKKATKPFLRNEKKRNFAHIIAIIPREHHMREENKRIAKNTLIVYARLVITTIIGLLSSRYVLATLGDSDYGLYNVVGATVIMFSFITSALYNTTTRFINYEQGKPDGNVNRIFNMSLAIHVCFAVVALAILESGGIYYILNYLNVAAGKEADAMFVFQVSTITTCLSLISVPYNSLYIVHEDFRFTAVLDILGAIVKFALILALLHYGGNLLRFYALSMALVTLLTSLAYFFLSRKRWPAITRFNLVKDIREYREILTFNNYSLLGAAALIFRNQGSSMVINFFFGTVVNAAYAISYSVQNYIITFVGNFDIASAPQITQNISRGNMDRTIFLASSTCRVCILLTLLLLFPIYCELPFILHLWLGDNVPEGTVTFCKCTLLVALVSATSGGITQLIRGTGRLKWFNIQFTVLYVLALLISIALYHAGFPPYTVILAYFVADVISRAIHLLLLHRYIKLDVGLFVQKSYLQPLGVFTCGIAYVLISGLVNIEHNLWHIADFVTAFLFIALTAYLVGLHKEERNVIASQIRCRLTNNRRK